jgi:hypothetical protein
VLKETVTLKAFDPGSVPNYTPIPPPDFEGLQSIEINVTCIVDPTPLF